MEAFDFLLLLLMCRRITIKSIGLPTTKLRSLFARDAIAEKLSVWQPERYLGNNFCGAGGISVRAFQILRNALRGLTGIAVSVLAQP